MNDFTLMMDKGMAELSSKGAFLTAKSAATPNTMTISWGFVGFIWNKPHFITVVRPTRYTNKILKAGADSFTVSIPFGTLREQLTICGRQSGRDIDKSDVVNFAAARTVASPIVADCDFYYECKILYLDKLHGDKIPADINKSHYNADWHDFFVGEIVETYGK